MNIFATFSCPVKSAQYLDTKRQIKMILESAQLLSTALFLNGHNGPYKPTHIKHPCALWTAMNSSHFMWVLRHMAALSREYTKKYGKIHKSHAFIPFFLSKVYLLPQGNLVQFVNCAANSSLGISYKHISNTHEAYKLYLDHRNL